MLVEIRDKLIDFLEKMDQGKLAYMKDIALKLRVLYFKKSGTEGLLKVVQNLFGFKIQVQVNYTYEEKVAKGLISKNLLQGLHMEQVNSPVSWFEFGDAVMDIESALNREEIFLNGKRYNYKKIIEIVADKMDAHIDHTVPDEDLVLHSPEILVGGLPIAQRAIYDIGRSSVQLIDIILEKHNSGNKGPMYR
ncbi:MAG: hypothetical protein WC004_02840 [Candidatus Absconditabacterales bacterium]